MRVGCTGHQGLPKATRESVARTLDDLFAGYQASRLVGFTCLADGADQLFAAALLNRGGALEIIVPAAHYRDGLPSAEARSQYDQLIAHARRIVELPFEESTEEAHMAAGRYIVDTSDILIAVWDGRAARGHGGTADVVEYARQQAVPVEIVWPPGASRD